MTALFLSIVLNAFLGISFSLFNRYKVDLFQAIVFNYWICVITGTMVLGQFPVTMSAIQTPWFMMAILMGVLFILVFNLIAFSTTKVGVTITQTANRLSLIIPVIVSYVAYHENVNWIKAIGIFLALLAVVFTSNRKEAGLQGGKISWEYFLPVLLFVGSGVIDTLTKYVQFTFITSEDIANAYLISGFMIAGICGGLVLMYLYATGQKKFSLHNLLAGIILGVPNYFSIYYLIKALQHPTLGSTAIIPINNIGVLFVVSMCGIFLFKEKLTKLNYIGLVLTLIAIVLIFLGDHYGKHL